MTSKSFDERKKNAWPWEPINVYGRCVIGWNKFGPAMSAFRREGSSVCKFCQLSKSESKEISIPTSKIWSKRDLITVGPHWFWWFEERHVHLLDEYGWDRVRILFWSRNTIHDAVLMMMMIPKFYTSYDSHFKLLHLLVNIALTPNLCKFCLINTSFFSFQFASFKCFHSNFATQQCPFNG